MKVVEGTVSTWVMGVCPEKVSGELVTQGVELISLNQ